MGGPLLIQPLDPWLPAAQALLAQSDAHMAALYPAESNHPASPQALAAGNVLFLGVWMDGELAGCGAVRTERDMDDAYGEVKRVFVAAPYRGKGLSRPLMQQLHAHLVGLGIPHRAHIIEIGEAELLLLHLAPDAVDVFRAAIDIGLDAG